MMMSTPATSVLKVVNVNMTWSRKAYTIDNDKWHPQRHLGTEMAIQGGIGYKKDLDDGVQLEAPGTPWLRE